MGKILRSQPFPNLRDFRLWCEEHEPWDDHSQPQNYQDECGDVFSTGVRRLCGLPYLHTLWLCRNIVLSPEAFTADESTDAVFSPSLRIVYIEFSVTTPDGKWYFTGDPSAPYEVESWRTDAGDPPVLFRDRPDDDLLVPLVSSLARAIRRMPALRILKLRLIYSGRRIHFEVHYFADGVSPNFGLPRNATSFLRSRAGARCFVDIGYGWAPSPSLKKAFIAISGDEETTMLNIRSDED